MNQRINRNSQINQSRRDETTMVAQRQCMHCMLFLLYTVALAPRDSQTTVRGNVMVKFIEQQQLQLQQQLQ